MRTALGALAGVAIMAALVMAGHVGLAFGLGVEGMFQPGTYEPSLLVSVLSLVVG